MSEIRDESAILDFGSPRLWAAALAFAQRALRRRWWVIALIALAFTAAGIGAAVLLPRTYSAQSQILARKNFTMAALAHPTRAVPPGAEMPAQAAIELVRSRDTLAGIVRRGHLVDRWLATRPWLLREKDEWRARVLGAPSRADLEDAVVELLAHRLRVSVQDDVVSIAVTWSDADGAAYIAQAAQQAFLDARRRIDVQSLADTYRILESEAAATQARLGDHLTTLRTVRRRATAGVDPLVGKREVRTLRLEGLRTSILAAREDRAELEKRRRERIVALQMKLSEQEATLGDRNPDLATTRDELERLLGDTAPLEAAKATEQHLTNDYIERGGQAEDLLGDKPGTLLVDASGRDVDADESVTYARALLRIDVDSYQDLVGRARDTEIEMRTALAAFPYRYIVTQPARRPHKPDAPQVPMVIVGALMAGVAAGMVAALSLEVRSRADVRRVVAARFTGRTRAFAAGSQA